MPRGVGQIKEEVQYVATVAIVLSSTLSTENIVGLALWTISMTARDISFVFPVLFIKVDLRHVLNKPDTCLLIS